MKHGPVGRELAAWGDLVEEIASTYSQARRGHITEREAEDRRLLLRFVLLNTPVH
jgi:hypothetical protein